MLQTTVPVIVATFWVWPVWSLVWVHRLLVPLRHYRRASTCEDVAREVQTNVWLKQLMNETNYSQEKSLRSCMMPWAWYKQGPPIDAAVRSVTPLILKQWLSRKQDIWVVLSKTTAEHLLRISDMNIYQYKHINANRGQREVVWNVNTDFGYKLVNFDVTLVIFKKNKISRLCNA